MGSGPALPHVLKTFPHLRNKRITLADYKVDTLFEGVTFDCPDEILVITVIKIHPAGHDRHTSVSLHQFKIIICP